MKRTPVQALFDTHCTAAGGPASQGGAQVLEGLLPNFPSVLKVVCNDQKLASSTY